MLTHSLTHLLTYLLTYLGMSCLSEEPLLLAISFTSLLLVVLVMAALAAYIQGGGQQHNCFFSFLIKDPNPEQGNILR